MAFLSSLNIGGSALTAQRYRMDIISQNIANAETTATQTGQPYYRKMVLMEERTEKAGFGSYLDQHSARLNQPAGVRISKIVEDERAFKLVYDPSHPDADQEGYVRLPNIDMIKEIMDMMSASRSYEANVTSINAIKSMAVRALDIGK